MKNIIKKAAMVAVLGTFTVTQAHAFCVYNKNQEGKQQVWYIMKNEKVAKEFLKAWEGPKLASSGVRIVSAAVASICKVSLGAGAASTKVKVESKAIHDVSKSLAEVLLNGMPSKGDVIVKPGGILSTADLKTAQANLGVRGGGTIKAGDKVCWDKKTIVQRFKYYLNKTTDNAYWIVLTDNKDGTFTFAKLGSEGTGMDIVAK